MSFMGRMAGFSYLLLFLLTASLSRPCFAIHGGGLAEGADYEAIVAIILNDNRNHHFVVCTGTLISANQVLTAAHCVYDAAEQTFGDPQYLIKNPQLMSVYRGPGKKLPARSSRGLKGNIAIKSITAHPSYLTNDTIRAIDLAVITLENDVLGVAPIAIPPENFQFDEVDLNNVYAAGYGADPEQFHGLKQSAKVTLQSVNASQEIAFMNAGDETSGICSGDSGGPLLTRLNGQLVLLGVASLSFGGEELCSPYPSIYYSPIPSKVRAALGLPPNLQLTN